MPKKFFRLSLLLPLVGLACCPVSSPAASATNVDVDGLHIRLTPRTPQQMVAFYEARGFSKAMLDKIRPNCFITVSIHNKSERIIWLDLANWTFSRDGKAIHRIHRRQLKQRWQRMHIPLAHQSIFRWTLLPEQLDFRPNEREGGNIVLPWTDAPITIRARFATLADKTGKPLSMRLTNIRCKKGPS